MSSVRSTPKSSPAPRSEPEATAVAAPSQPLAAVLGPLLIVLLVLASYSNSFSGAFVLDDLGAIVHNDSLHTLNPAGVLLGMPVGTTVSGRPILNASLALNYALGGLHVEGYHAFNLLIHLLASLTLYGIIRRTAGRIRWPAQPDVFAFCVAALWAVHPLQTEAVSYVIQRAESLMGLFYLLVFYGFVRAAENEGKPASGLWVRLSVLSCLLCAGTKEIAVTAPLLVLLFDRTFYAGSVSAAFKARGKLYAGLAVSWVLLFTLVLTTGGNRSGTSGFNVGVSPIAYWLTQFEALIRYLALSVWPAPLVFEYGTFWQRGLLPVLPYAVPVIGLAAMSLWAFFQKGSERSGWRYFGFLGVWFFGILSVTSLVPGIYQMIVEHRMYLPLAAILVAAAALLWNAGTRIALVVSAVAISVCATLTFARNEQYKSAVTLWQDTVNKRPDNETAQVSLAVALYKANRISEAIPHYEAALALRPSATDTLNDLGCALVSLNRIDEALPHLKEAARLKPQVVEYRLNLANALAAKGYFDQAIPEFQEVVRIEPTNAKAHLSLAMALLQVGRQTEAEHEYSEANSLGDRHL